MAGERQEVFSGQRHLVEFRYRDAVGNETERLVDFVDGYRACGYGYLYGWCRGFLDWRTFRDDRIQSWSVRGAGQAKEASLLAELGYRTRAGVLQTGTPPPLRTEAKVPRRPSFDEDTVAATTLDELVAMIGVVVFVARVDGRVLPNEVTILRRFVFSWGRNLARPSDLVQVQSSEVSREEYLDALRVLARSPLGIRESVVAGAMAVADASDGIREDEEAAILEIAAALRIS